MIHDEPTAPPRWATVIAEARKAKNLSQADLGKLVGAAQSTVNGWEKGLSRPRPRTAGYLAKILGIDTATLLLEMDPDFSEAKAEQNLREGLVALFVQHVEDLARQIAEAGWPTPSSTRLAVSAAFREWLNITDPPIGPDYAGLLQAHLADSQKIVVPILREMRSVMEASKQSDQKS